MPDEVLRAVLLAAAEVVVARPAMSEQVTAGLTAQVLLDRDPVAVGRLLARSGQLRAVVARRTGLPTDGPPVGDDAAEVSGAVVSGPVRVAHMLLSDAHTGTALEYLPGCLVVAAAATSAPTAAEPAAQPKARRKDGPSADEKQLRYAQQRLTEAKAQAQRLRGQLEFAHTERDSALARAGSAESDVADAQAELAAARSDVAAARRQLTDVAAAARVLLSAASPARVEVSDDPRVREQQMLSGGPQAAVTDTPVDLRVAAALTQAGADAGVLKQLRQVLAALLSPVAPEPVRAPVVMRQREFVVTPLGGGEEIGGSCILVEVGDTRILVDVGMRPKARMAQAGPPLIDQALKGRIDAIVITHAHNDHAGYVPAVVAAQPTIPVFTTSGTAALLSTMWADSVTVFGHISRESAARAAASPLSRIKGGALAPSEVEDDRRAPFTTEEWRAARDRVVEVEYGRAVPMRGGMTLELFPAGHVLGACGVVVAADGRRVTVTGDVSDLAQQTVPGLVVPDSAVGSDLIVIESTYCRRPDGHTRAHAVEAFLSTVAETVEGGGRVLVPAFALGRAQEVALLLRERMADVPVLIDGMAGTISEIYEQQTAGDARPLRIFGDNVERVRHYRREQTIAEFRRGVVVTTSGMLAAGPAIPWARAILPDPSSALLIAGYQDEESPGAELLRLADDTSGAPRQFTLDGKPVPVGARVAKFSLSAHADRAGLTSIIDRVDAADVMLVHGLASSQREYREVLRARGNSPVPTGVWAAE